ncbi:non-ribosomal peptide synthetase [Duganella sp. Root1480D1]|uniref:non-ribosomal peptide synthetase n=1 Tax=Duganella sp. Root1480D1 TaxID=1736471 RepID=UPI000709279F|nr:non-ribosomal peptide synthetase [Duganella sp. Root1480D1]KQZ31362.1 hypothetical protein ASD58_30005 [Duganella sp. Root1480D1]
MQLEAAELRQQVAGALADYMVPSAFVTLAAIPLNANGKVDRRALPAPEQEDLARQRYEAPCGEVEQQVAQIWQDLLGVEQVGRQDHFFELGGHSLLAVRVVAQLRNALGIEVPMRDVFLHPRLAQFAAAALSTRRATLAAIPLADRSQPLPLSWAQQRLWFLAQLDQAAGAAYHMPAAIRLEGELERDALQAALDRVIARHENLRTCFVTDGEQTVQRILPEHSGCPLLLQDLSALPEPQRSEAAARLANEEAAEPFNLATGPLVRGRLLRLGEREHLLLVTMHHIVSDGWSKAIFVREMAQLYTAFSQGAADPLPPLAIQYADYAAWQRAQVQGAALQDQLAFWQAHLHGAPTMLTLPADRARPAVQSYAGGSVPLLLDGALVAGLRELGRRHGCTLFMTLLAGWSALLGRLAGQGQVVVGTPAATRQRAELEPLIGYFLNTLAIQVDLQAAPSVAGLLAQVRSSTLDAYANQEVPFEMVLDAVKPERSLSHNPLFQAVLMLNNTPQHGVQSLRGLSVSAVAQDDATAQFDLALVLAEDEHGIAGQLKFASDLFEAATVERWSGHLLTLLSAMVADPECPVERLPLLAPQQSRQLLEDWNQSAQAYPLEQTFDQLFRAQVARYPQHIAAACADERLSYQELDQRAARLAQAVLAAGATRDTLVTLLCERDLRLLAAMTGVLRAGAAFLPLDANHPPARLREVMDASASPLVLVARSCLPVLAAIAGAGQPLPPHLVLDDCWLAGPAPELAPRGAPQDLAYVIFTSGSTGKPKGAMVEQYGMLNHMFGKLSTMAIGAGDTLAQTASPAFDICVWQFLSALLVGGTTDVLPDEVAYDPAQLLGACSARGVTLLQTVPSMMRSMLDVCPPGLALPGLRWLIPTGEALTPALTQEWFARFPAVPLMNVYGPAECSDDVTYHAMLAPPPPEAAIPIGRPTPNNRIFILDRHLQPVPVGVVGEICVDGAGVGRGYLDNPEQTARAFVPHPFQPGQRFYRTGDLGRYRADGIIEFCGRIDHQIKLRGFRIELGEIEAKLAACRGVREALVLAREDVAGAPRLAAYLLAQPNAELSAAAVRAELGAVLPDYMVPAAFVMLDAFPLTPNGKIDRKALPAPDLDLLAGRQHEAPAGALEEALAGIWQDVLGVTAVGRGDHFFELGGHSLLAAQLISRIRASLGVEVALRDLFAQPGFSGFADVVRAAGAASGAPLAPAARGATAPLSWAQQRLWFLAQLDEAATLAYNMPNALALDGALDRAALQAALDRVVARHEVLRTRFVSDGETAQALADGPASFALDYHDLGALAGHEQECAVERHRLDEARTAFDLRSGPLIRGRLLRLGQQAHVLLLTKHHIVSDGWSAGIFIREVSTLYAAYCAGAPDPLPPLPLQYADYAIWQRSVLQGEVLREQAAFWRQHLEGAPALIELPTDRPRPPQQSYAGSTLRFNLDASLTADLRALGMRHGATLFMTLLSGWSLLLARWSGQSDIVVGTTAANRQRSEVEGLIGFFVNTQALRVRLPREATVAELLAQVRETTLQAQERQDLPFEQVVEAVNPPRSLTHSPLFQTMLTLNNTPAGASLALPGLTLTSLDDGAASTRFDLTLAVTEGDGRLHLQLQYASALFDAATVQRMAGHFQVVLQAMAADAAQPLHAVRWLGEQERRQLLDGFNPPQLPAAAGALAHQPFEDMAARHPAAPALVTADGTLSYAELDARANRLARRLQAAGVAPGERVALCAERSAEMVVGLLAVLKAGGAVVPLDPSYPAARLAHIFQDSAPLALLVSSPLRALLPPLAVPVLLLDQAPQQVPEPDSAYLPPPALRADHPAYLIYTSGSTGTPKGVLCPHGALHNLVGALLATYGMGQDSRLLQMLPIGFDVGISEILLALSCGGQLHLAEREQALGGALAATLRQRGISHVHLPPALLATLAPQEMPAGLHIVTGGEALPPALAREWSAHFPLYNSYGPTETTVCATVQRCRPEQQGSVPIGRPLANVRLYILDADGAPVAAGVIGEIHIGGAGVAHGYWRLPEQSAQRFVPDPFLGGAARMYRSGDLGRWLADGSIEYHGRNDQQIKLRGHRIEPGEIEQRLAACDGVREAAVAVRADQAGRKRLLAWVAGPQHGTLDVAALRRRLAGELPDYMVPAAIVALAALPLTAHGKVDHSALPEPAGAGSAADQVPPQGDIEQALARIWQELLGTAPIGRHAHFFELGGHSLLAVQMLGRIREQFEVELPLKTLFQHPQLSDLADALVALQLALYADTDGLDDEIDSLSETELLALLSAGDGNV